MIAKIRLIFLVAVLAHQIADRACSGDKIDDALAKLQKVVDEEVAEANKQLDAAKAQVDAFAAQVQDQAKKAMNSTEEAFKKQLDALKEKAKAKGVNIDECLGENEKKLVDLPNVASNDMIHCVTDRVNEAIGYIQTGLNQPTYAKHLESKASEIVDSTRTDVTDDNEIEQLKITLKSVFDSIKNQAAESENNALQETEDLMMGNVKEDESVYLSGIIQKVKKCAKQIIEESKDKIASLMEELKRIMEDMSKIRDCKGTKEERHECIKQNIDLVNQDISTLIEDSSKQIQWLMNDILPDFYQCVTTDQDMLIK